MNRTKRILSFTLVLALVCCAIGTMRPQSGVADITLDGGDETEPLDLNGALNVPDGTINFHTDHYPSWGMYGWEVEDDYAVSTNMNADGTLCMVYATVNYEVESEISFDYCVSSDDGDVFDFRIDNNIMLTRSGEVDWDNFSCTLPAGRHEISWYYSKDESGSQGSDRACLDNVAINISSMPTEEPTTSEPTSTPSFTPPVTEDLNEALNYEGGEIVFTTEYEPENGLYPFVAENGYARSTNNGVSSWFDSDYNTIESRSIVSAEIDFDENEILSFYFRVSSESYDELILIVDGKNVASWGGEYDWQEYQYMPGAGTHTISFVYSKDFDVDEHEDTVYLDDVRVCERVNVQGVEFEESSIELPQYQKQQLEWTVLPQDAFDKTVTFRSEDETIVSISDSGVIFGINPGTAKVFVSTTDGGCEAECTVTVTYADAPAQIYGFQFSEQYIDEENGYGYSNGAHLTWISWASFYETCPENINRIGMMPETSDQNLESQAVYCAEAIGNKIYGYTQNNHFFIMDFDSLKFNLIDVEYFSENPVAGGGLLFEDMSYDITTDRLWALAWNIEADGTMQHYLLEIDRNDGSIINFNDPTRITGPLDDDGQGRIMTAFAIDSKGNAYCVSQRFGDNYSDPCSLLCSLDLQTGVFSVIGETGFPAYQNQSLAFDRTTDTLYWSQFASFYGMPNGLCIIDTNTGAAHKLETIGKGSCFLGMIVVPGESEVTPPTPELAVTVTPEPPVTEPPVTETPAPPTDAPVDPSDAPVDPSEAPAPGTPATGGSALVGVGVAAILAGAGVVLAKKKED